MKYMHMILVASMSFAGLNDLNAMSNVPDVTKWQEICKDPQEKQKLVTVYRDFCRKRAKNTISYFMPYMVSGWALLSLGLFNCKPTHPQFVVPYAGFCTL